MDAMRVFDRMEAMEYRLSSLYAHYQRLFAADVEAAKLFASLSRDEVSHAGIIRFQKRFVAKGEFPAVSVDLAGVESMITRIDGLMGESPSLENALKLALEMEASSAELHYRTAAEQEDSGIAGLVKGLGDQDNKHHRKLTSFVVARFDRGKLASDFGAFPELLAEWTAGRASGENTPKLKELSDRISKTLAHFGNMNHYEVLIVGRGAGPDEIRHAYHRAVKEWHPDRFDGYPDDLRTRLHSIVAGINEAYRVLSNVERRYEYDRLLAKKDRMKGSPVSEDEQKSIDGLSRLADKDYSGALEAFDAALRLSPKAKYSYHRAAALRGLGRRKEALQEIRTALANSPSSAAYHLFAAQVSLELGDQSGAAKAFRRVLELDPGNERAVHGLERSGARARASPDARMFRKGAD
ncbi:MAG: DnaJ domain-containing protein [Acidobacteria bacterium]|nr:DnaJ domain-containing protein [Acidobacteriota bacterium]